MAMPTANTRKSHKSRKTDTAEPVNPESQPVPVGGPSSTEPATADPSVPNPLALALVKPQEGEEQATKDTPIIAPVANKQWWYRPNDSKARKVVAKIVVMDAAGHKDEAIAKKLSTTAASVRQYRYLAKKNGWLRSNDDGEDELIDLETDLALDVDRKIVRNISASLDGQMTNWQTHEMTIAAAKGRGVFKNHEVSKNEGPQTLPVVAIQVVMPALGAGDQLPEVAEDQMGGTPAYYDGQVLDGFDEPAK